MTQPVVRATRARLLAGAALALLLAAGTRAQDSVIVLNRERKPTPQPGVVVSETLAGVKVRNGDRERSFDSRDVQSIAYGPGSPAFELAEQALAAGDFVNAESLFARAAQDAEPPWVAAHALLRKAASAARRGSTRLPQARADVEEFLRRFPEHRLLPEALLDKAGYASEAGAAAEAEAALAQVHELARDGRVTPDWSVRAHLALADQRLDAGDGQAAAASYAAAGKAAADGSRQVADRADLQAVLATLSLAARTGSASCLLLAGDVAGARRDYTRLAADGQGDPTVEAAAANGLAECDLREPGRLKDAQLAFARVAVTAVRAPGERARALYFLGQCAVQLGEQAREPDGRQKAAAYYQDVIDRYPDTRWARLARQELP